MQTHNIITLNCFYSSVFSRGLRFLFHLLPCVVFLIHFISVRNQCFEFCFCFAFSIYLHILFVYKIKTKEEKEKKNIPERDNFRISLILNICANIFNGMQSADCRLSQLKEYVYKMSFNSFYYVYFFFVGFQSLQ